MKIQEGKIIARELRLLEPWTIEVKQTLEVFYNIPEEELKRWLENA